MCNMVGFVMEGHTSLSGFDITAAVVVGRE